MKPNPPRRLTGQSASLRAAIDIPFVRLAVLAFAVLLTGCASLPQTFRQSLTVIVPHQVDFAELEYYAKRSRAAYTAPSEIRREFPQTTRVTTVETVGVRYFLETDQQAKTHTLTIRGTSNRANVWQDIEIRLVRDSVLGIDLHRGFRRDAQNVHADVRPFLRKDYSIRLTGHSLGAAIAGITAGYLFSEGFKVERLVTFGGPKVTNRGGKKAMQEKVKVTRVVHHNDVVPMIPPTGLLTGSYQHFGPEVILRDGRKYVYLPDHNADRLSIGEFWRNITDFSTKEHHMILYLSNIEEKVQNGVRQVPYFGSGGQKDPGPKTQSTAISPNPALAAQHVRLSRVP